MANNFLSILHELQPRLGLGPSPGVVIHVIAPLGFNIKNAGSKIRKIVFTRMKPIACVQFTFFTAPI